MKSVILGLPGNETISHTLATRLDAEVGEAIVRHFPDGESYVRIKTQLSARQVIMVCTLDRPHEKILPLLFAAATAKELGATKIGLVAPYLAYMRQDSRFRAGEAITSVHFARLLSSFIDWLVTVDPHLHRRSSLSEIYSIPSKVVHAAPRVSEWIRENVNDPVLIGPDGESEQWVAAVAAAVRAPYVVLKKFRRGDRDVEVSVPEIEQWQERTPVLVDDIISTARTMIETVAHLKAAGMRPPVCIGVHGIFAGNAHQELLTAGAARVVTCNTVPHASNGIDLSDLLVEAVGELGDRGFQS
jgi:ribose-phosphate pyrophosphokinase